MAQSRHNFSHRDGGGHQSTGSRSGRGIHIEPVNGAARQYYDDGHDHAGSDVEPDDGYHHPYESERHQANGHGRYDRINEGDVGGPPRHETGYPETGYPETGYPETGYEVSGDHRDYEGPQPAGGRTSVSVLLREAREDAGYSLRDVSSILRIRLAHLESIEDGRFDDLPGTVYAVGFVRAFSDLVGLDGEAMVKRFKDEVSGIPDQTELHFPTPTSDGRLPGIGLVTIAVLLAGVAYGGWYYVSESDRNVGDFIPAIPDRFAGLLEGWSGETPPIDEIGETADEPGTDSGPDSGIGLADTGDTSAGQASTGDDLGPGIDSSAVDGPVAGRDVAPQDTGAGVAAGSSEAGQSDTGQSDAGETDLGETASEDSGPQGASAEEIPNELSIVADDEATQSPSVLTDDTPSDTALAVPGYDEPPLPETAAESGPDAGGAGDATPDRGQEGGSDGDLEEQQTASADGTAASDGAAGEGGRQVTIRAESDSWVQIRDSLGSLLMTRVMRAGEQYEVPDESGLTMVTGNAGGLYVTVGGEPAPPLGGAGDVVRGISLEPEALLEGTAAP
ncbi:RodZ domain-containing protein [Fodinicurvata sp. EGI_FJ10296]|uniref:helix-turn-helix domain-containing protein n=1 Tax=Fodinicurvata sp. EGI_FJ10296 TaxID=3231908 RepID=UPI0034526B7D